MAEADMIATQRLQGQVSVRHLVVGVGIEQLSRFVVQHLAQQRGQRFALGEPLPAEFGQDFGRLALVQRDEAGDPAIGEILMVQPIEDAGPGQIGKTENGQGAQMRLAQHRLQPAGEWRIDQQDRRGTTGFPARRPDDVWSKWRRADRSEVPASSSARTSGMNPDSRSCTRSVSLPNPASSCRQFRPSPFRPVSIRAFCACA